jgi:hypothetical protein
MGNKLITSHHADSSEASYHISHTNVILAKLPSGDKPGPKTALRTAIDTLIATLLLPVTTEHRKLPKPNTTNAILIHHTWYPYLNTRGLPAHIPTNFETLIKRSSHNTETLKRPAATQTPPSPITPTTPEHGLQVLEVDNNKIQIHNTIYHYVNNLNTAHITAKRLCQHIDSGLTQKNLARIDPEDEDTPILSIPYKVEWNSAWLT